MKIQAVSRQWDNETLRGLLKVAEFPPKGDQKDGFFGFSRMYDRLVDTIPTIDAQLETISIGPYVSRFAFSKDAPPDMHLQVSWAGHGEDDGSVRLVLEESGWDFASVRTAGRYVIKTDKNHNANNNDYFGTMVEAVFDLKEKSKIGLTPFGRWGFSRKFLYSTFP